MLISLESIYRGGVTVPLKAGGVDERFLNPLDLRPPALETKNTPGSSRGVNNALLT